MDLIQRMLPMITHPTRTRTKPDIRLRTFKIKTLKEKISIWTWILMQLLAVHQVQALAISVLGHKVNSPPPLHLQLSINQKARSAPNSPIILRQENSDCVSIPTAGALNAFHLMKIAKPGLPVKARGRGKKTSKTNSLNSLNLPIPGINKIKSPVNTVSSATESKHETTPKRNHDTMTEKDE
jgi:hypothetical protein